MTFRLRYVLAASGVAGFLALGVVGAVALRSEESESSKACPAGYSLIADAEAAERRAGVGDGDYKSEPAHEGSAARDEEARGEENQAGENSEQAREAEKDFEHETCISSKHPEKLIELILRQEGLESVRSAPYDHVAPGAFANAVEQSKQLPKASKPTGTSGTWSQFGTGPLIVNDPDYSRVNGLGLVDNMGRLDSLEYDASHNRLFAAKGTGGIWLSENRGDTWRSIGDGLPSQIVGAVGYTPANGGTIVAISGDGTYGSGGYTGYGAFYSTDVGATWQKATGIPNGALGFAIEADPTNPNKVYAATSLGLYRSTDGGKTYTNVKLPTGPCAGVEGGGSCQLANMVTDVVVRGTGGVNGQVSAGAVTAAVGWRAGQRTNSDGTVQSPNNGIYRSATGDPGSFTKQAATGFTPQDRIGRIELGEATGAQQDKDYLYAIVQDAQALNGQLDVLDASGVPDPRGGAGTVVNGVFVSADFGATWTRMADSIAIAKNPASGSALAGVGNALGYEPGVQAWYNEWIAPDPTRQSVNGIPNRLAFGLEEVWQNDLPAPMIGPTSFKVIGRYYGGGSCMLLNLGLPACPTTRDTPQATTTTHPDQQEGLWIPDATGGGVTLAVGNDGGFYKQHADADQELSNARWGSGNQSGFATLLPYDVAMANDGTTWAGLQDNGHMKIDSRTRKQYETFGGDGTFAEVDPANSDVAYESYVYGEMAVTKDGGKTWTNMIPPISNARFVNPFEMDSTDANHLITAGRQVVETTYGPETTGVVTPPVVGDPTPEGSLTTCCGDKPWTGVFNLGTAQHPGSDSAVPTTTDPANSTTALDVIGDESYAGYCGVCDILNAEAPFQSGIATNAGGSRPANRMTTDGWHIAAAQGLPERIITSIAIDPSDATHKTIYVTLGGYTKRWVPPGTLQDKSVIVGVGHLFKSSDAGATFTDVTGDLPDVPATWVTLRGKQLIVGTDVGVFATDTKGKPSFSFLNGLPVVPISTMNLKPDDPNLLVVAAYGRGIWTYCFEVPVRGTTGGCPITPKPLPVQPTAPTGVSLAGPYGFELNEEGWTTTTNGLGGATTWRRMPLGNASSSSFGVSPYLNNTETTLVSPVFNSPGGWTFVEFASRRNTEGGCSCDFVVVEWSSDNGASWKPAQWRWDADLGDWSLQTAFDGMNADYPLFTTEKAAFNVPAGSVKIRFRFSSDDLVQLEGEYVDDVKIGR